MAFSRASLCRRLGVCVPLILFSVAAGLDNETGPHWAYQPIASIQPPKSKNMAWPRTPIDRFILARLEKARVKPSPTADKRALLRRVYYDLIGLPPTPEETRAFLADNAPDAYARVVDRLLASPRYGERWARNWMDVVHFAETHGHDQDRIRTNAWPYRDYLIASFNADKPYDRFAQEQVAGDVLFPDDPQATVALGLIAAGPWDESSLRDIREDTVDRQIARYLDRDDMVATVMQTFASTTVQCARCHDHKFDPIPQADYYSLQAVFAGIDRANRSYDADPATHRRRQELVREKRSLTGRSVLLSAESDREVARWEKKRAGAEWSILIPQTFVSSDGADLKRLEDGSLLAGGARPDKDIYTITAVTMVPVITAVRLEAMTDPSLPHRGPGRQDNGNLHLSEFQLMVFEPGQNSGQSVRLARATADFNQSGWTIEHALDRNEKTAWGIHPKEGEAHEAVFALAEPLRLKPGSTLAISLRQLHGEGHLIGRPRLSVTGADSENVTALPAGIRRVLETSATMRSEDDRAALAAFVLNETISQKLERLPKPSLVYAAASEFEPDGGLKPAGEPRLVQVLRRGDIHKPTQVASPGALGCVRQLPSRFPDLTGEGSRRAALARWLSHRDNPLFWRSIVNRVWLHHFGRGLVETPNDFGKMGMPPGDPELLDWLAAWFRDEAHGSIKQLDRLMVLSAVYGLSSDANPRAGNSTDDPGDAENRLYSRMNRRRLDAEEIRDTILQVSDSLDLRMGGPSDMQFDLQPGHHVTPKVDYTRFDVASPAAKRRSVYRFLFRTLPDPFMDALDCPAGDQLSPMRNASVTVQQALALWNNAFVLHYVEKFAARVAALGKTEAEQVEWVCRLALNRAPTPEEATDFVAHVRAHGLASFCRVILNSNEFIFVE